MNYKQDMPPPGGYAEFDWRRSFPKTWINAKRITIGVVGFGLYSFFLYRYNRRVDTTLYLEDLDIRCAIDPFMKAERDRKYLKMLKKNRELEEDLMKDVPGWKMGTWYGEPTYYTLGDRWFDPSFFESFPHTTFVTKERDLMWGWHQEYSHPKFYDKYLPRWIHDRIY